MTVSVDKLFVYLTSKNVSFWNVCVGTAGLHNFSCVKILNGVLIAINSLTHYRINFTALVGSITWFCWKFTSLSSSERILKICKELTKLLP